MRNVLVIFAAITLALSFSGISQAETWDVSGNWQECFIGGGPGQAGNVITASGDHWSLAGALLDSVTLEDDDPVTYRTIYKSGRLQLNQEGPWGFNLTATDVELAVIHTKRDCVENETPSPYGCFFFEVSGQGAGQIDGVGATVNCVLQASYNYDPANFVDNPLECGEGVGGMAGALDSASLTLDWADITKSLTAGSPTVEIGSADTQAFSFTIQINNLARFGDVVFRDTVPAEFDLDPNLAIDAEGCEVNTYRNRGADKGKNPKLEPEFLKITPLEGAEACTVTVPVVTDGNPGHYDRTTGTFSLYEPTSCDDGTVVLNDGVEVMIKEGGFGFQDEDSVLLNCEEPVDG